MLQFLRSSPAQSGVFRFDKITITPNMSADALEGKACFRRIKLKTATVYLAKVRWGTVPFDLRITARNDIVKSLELRMYENASAPKSLEGRFAAHNKFLKARFGDRFQKGFRRIRYSFAWGNVSSYMDIKTGECVIEMEYSDGAQQNS